MKTKQGFVTNSSSSSFIVAWDKELTNDDLDYITEKVTFVEKARIILRDSIEYGPITFIKDEESIEDTAYKIIGKAHVEGYSGRFYSIPDFEDLISLMKKSIGKYLYYYHYGDEDGGIFAQLEHGYTFDSVPHIRDSHH